MIRVGYFNNNAKTNYPGFMIVDCASSGLTPCELRDEKNRIIENVWQASKVYKRIPAMKIKRSKRDETIIWEYPAEDHVYPLSDTPNDAYWRWRRLLENHQYAVRFPAGLSRCLYTLVERPGSNFAADTIESRKQLLIPMYAKCVKKHPMFKELKDRLVRGENLLIIEPDMPRPESLAYYKQKYGVTDTFIQHNTMEINERNITIMLNDLTRPFGYGYCLAMCLLNKDEEWNK